MWAWATHFNFLGRSCVCYAATWDTSGGYNSKVVWPITAILLGAKWSWLLLRIALQDALSEVNKILPASQIEVFVDDIPRFHAWEKQGVGGDARIDSEEA